MVKQGQSSELVLAHVVLKYLEQKGLAEDFLTQFTQDPTFVCDDECLHEPLEVEDDLDKLDPGPQLLAEAFDRSS